MDQLKEMKETLMNYVHKEFYNLKDANTEELGQAVDMIKDLAEAIYYCTVAEAMEGKEYETKYYDPYRDIDRNSGKMYYGEKTLYPLDYKKEGRSPMMRKMYMEAKEMHHGKDVQMRELENYMQELTNDISEMIRDASPEEKTLLQKKIATLATKIEQMNV